MTHAPGNGIEELYKSVIEETANSSREAFLDENVDMDVLEQLTKLWEEKINKSGAVDLNSKPTTAIPATRPVTKPVAPTRPNANGNRGAPSKPNDQPLPTSTQPQMVFPPNLVSSYLQNNGNSFIMGTGLPPNVLYVPISLGQQQQQQQQQQDQLPQLDGGNNLFLSSELEDAIVKVNSTKGTMTIDCSKNPKLAEKLEQSRRTVAGPKTGKPLKPIPQVDGGPEMSDSDSEEEEDEEALANMVDIAQPPGDVELEPTDEAPLNSEDDQSDEEDLDTLFESTNIIVCQFEKVNRARNKWKFTLKDGIMHLDGKDYCFQKCSGEAEW
uniref:Transcription initiation factor IIA subunit 1 n=1 Tax=Panagrellus redivivus TaxID=6233 RepID=A0A7E4VV58_PANRE